MEKLLKKIDFLINDIEKDSNRTKLPELLKELIWLSVKLWENKRNLVSSKAGYERLFIYKKENCSQYLEKKYNDEYKEELKTNPKAKKNRITNVEIENMVNLEMLNPQEWETDYLKDIEEAQWIIAYLDPIIKSYYEWINSIKFVDRETVKVEKAINNDLPF